MLLVTDFTVYLVDFTIKGRDAASKDNGCLQLNWIFALNIYFYEEEILVHIILFMRFIVSIGERYLFPAY